MLNYGGVGGGTYGGAGSVIAGIASLTGGSIAPATSGVTTVIGVSGAAVSAPSDTNEDTLATFTLPANTLGANGCVRVRCRFDYTNSANNKTLKVKFGGSIVFTVTRSTNLSSTITLEIHNAGLTNSQYCESVEVTGAAGVGTQTNSSAIDTTSAVTILITGQKALNTETLTLSSWTVEAIH